MGFQTHEALGASHTDDYTHLGIAVKPSLVRKFGLGHKVLPLPDLRVLAVWCFFLNRRNSSNGMA